MTNSRNYTFISYVGLFAATTLLVMESMLGNPSPMMGVVCTVVLTVAVAFYCLADFSRRIGFAVFAACLFTFQLAGITLPVFTGDRDWMMGFTEKEYLTICNCLLITCLSLVFATNVFEKVRFVYGNNRRKPFAMFQDTRFSIKVMQKWAFIICIISSAVAIAGECQKMLFALVNGYMSLYGDYSSAPMVRRMMIVSKTSMFIGLAALPEKKRVWTYFVLGFPVAIMTFIEGTRSGLLMYLLFYAYYLYTYRDWKQVKIGTKERRRNVRKFIFFMLAAVSIFAPFLYIYGYSRVGRTYESASHPIQYIIRFFASQGGSAQLIGWAERYKGQLPGTCYSFGSFIDRFQGNNYVAFSVDSALKTNKFGNMMTYLYSPYNYTVLHTGVGSSYIAEVYYDFGYIGLALVNFIIGYILKLLTSFDKVSVFGKSIVFMLFYYMLTIPRASLMSPLENMFSSSAIFTIFIVFFLSRKRK